MFSCSKTNLGDQGKGEEGGKQRLEAAFIRRLRLQKVSQNPPVVPESNLRMEAAEMSLACVVKSSQDVTVGKRAALQKESEKPEHQSIS